MRRRGTPAKSPIYVLWKCPCVRACVLSMHHTIFSFRVSQLWRKFFFNIQKCRRHSTSALSKPSGDFFNGSTLTFVNFIFAIFNRRSRCDFEQTNCWWVTVCIFIFIATFKWRCNVTGKGTWMTTLKFPFIILCSLITSMTYARKSHNSTAYDIVLTVSYMRSMKQWCWFMWLFFFYHRAAYR